MSNDNPWILKYSPTSLDDLILSDEQKDIFRNMIKNNSLSNISLFGRPGIGKTTLAKILAEAFHNEYWIQPCSIDGSIDMIKSTIKDFCEIYSNNKFKIIILDEADQISIQGQLALRNIIFDHTEDCRFILTANYQDKINSALKSRCVPFVLEFSSKDILKRCVKILKSENITFTKEEITKFYNEIILNNSPDIRLIIQQLQIMSISGELKVVTSNKIAENNEVVKYIKDHILDDIVSLRTYTISNEDKFSGDYVLLSQQLFDEFQTKTEIMAIIADALWKMSFQLDKEIQFIGMLISMQQFIKGSNHM